MVKVVTKRQRVILERMKEAEELLGVQPRSTAIRFKGMMAGVRGNEALRCFELGYNMRERDIPPELFNGLPNVTEVAAFWQGYMSLHLSIFD